MSLRRLERRCLKHDFNGGFSAIASNEQYFQKKAASHLMIDDPLTPKQPNAKHMWNEPQTPNWPRAEGILTSVTDNVFFFQKIVQLIWIWRESSNLWARDTSPIVALPGFPVSS